MAKLTDERLKKAREQKRKADEAWKLAKSIAGGTAAANAAIQKTEADLAMDLGISRTMLARYRKRGCEGTTVEEINEWRKANLDQTRGGPAGSQSGDTGKGVSYKAWRARREKFVAIKARLDVEERKAELLPAADVRRALVEWAVMLRTRIVAIPDEISAVVPQELKATIKRIAEAGVRQGLKNAFEAALLGDGTIEDLIVAEADRIRAEGASK